MEYSVDTLDSKENESGGFPLIPEGIYEVQIIDKADMVTTKNNDPMVNIKMEIFNGEQKGNWLWDNIVIPNVGSPAYGIMGRTMHFLHVIGEPYQGKFKTESERWLFRSLKVKVKHELQEKGKYKGKLLAKIQEYLFIKEEDNDPTIPF
jgi:hypothetical protein